MTSSLLALPERRQTWAAYLVLLTALSVICFGSLAGHLLDTHDQETFKDNIATSNDFSYFFNPASQKELGSGRPVAELVKWLAYTVWGNDPAAFHLLVVGFHTLASFLLGCLARKQGLPLDLSMAGGLLFLVNVSHFQAVHWISALDYPLALTWGLGAMFCYLCYLQSPRRRWLWGFYSALLLATLSHLALLLIWPLCLYRAYSTGGDWKKAVGPWWPFGLVLLPALAFIFYLTAGDASTSQAVGSYSAAQLPQLLLGMGRLLLWFASRLLTTAHWLPLPIHQQQDWELLPGLALLAGLGWLLWKRTPHAAAWALWTLSLLLPFLLLTEDIVLDMPAGPSRYLYFASGGSSMLLAWLLGRLSLGLGRLVRPWTALTGSTALLVLFSYGPLKKTEALSLYTSGRNYIAQGKPALGIAQLRRALAEGSEVIPLQDTYRRLCFLLLGREEVDLLLDEALRRFPKDFYLNLYRETSNSLSSDPLVRQQAQRRIDDFVRERQGPPGATTESLIAQSYFNTALNLEEYGEQTRAILAYRRALAYDPSSAKAQKHLDSLEVVGTSGDPASHFKLGNQHYAAGHLEAAVQAYQEALRLGHEDPRLYANLGAILHRLGRLPEAAQACRQALQLDPDNPVFYHNLGGVELARQDWESARAAFQQALRLGYDQAQTYLGLGRAYRGAGQQDAALEIYRQVLAKDLASATDEVYAALGMDLLSLGQTDEAVQACRKALQKNEHHLSAQVIWGKSLYLQGNFQEALSHFRQAMSLHPNSAAQFGLGLVYLRAGQVEEARRAYAEGVKNFGAPEAEKIGAVEDLKALLKEGSQAAEARALLEAYWK